MTAGGQRTGLTGCQSWTVLSRKHYGCTLSRFVCPFTISIHLLTPLSRTVSAGRIVLKDFTFHDGTVAPKGSTVAINTRSIHHDHQFYPDPDTFKPFRFVNDKERPSSRSATQPQKLAVAPGLDYHPFGIGRPAWCVSSSSISTSHPST